MPGDRIDEGRIEVETNGHQTLAIVDYGTVQVLATVDPCTNPRRVEDAIVAAGRELVLALNGPVPRTLFTLPESMATAEIDPHPRTSPGGVSDV